MPAYADVEDPKALLAQDPGLEGGSSIEDAIADAGFQVQAVNWVWEKVVGEDLVSSIITPITGDFEKIAKGAAQWNNVRDALQAVRNNLNGGLEELQPHWQGDAAERFYQLIGTTWTLGIEADAQAAKLIGIALSKVADGSKRACDQILDLIEKLVNKLIEAAAMLPIPVVGWGRAVKLVYDGIQIYNAIMNLIQGIQQIIEGAQQVISGITSVGTALSKLGSADSLNDLINVGNDAGQGISDIKGGASSIRDGATQVSSSATDLSDSANSARDNARGLADERASARDQTSTSGTDTGTGNAGGADSTTTDRSRNDDQSSARPDDPDSTRTPENNRVCENDPVDIASGDVVLGQTDVALPGVLPLVLKRTHISSYRAGQTFGRNWASTFDQRLEFDGQGVVFVADDGMILVYPEPAADGPVLPQTGPRWPLSRTPTGWAVTQREAGQTLHFAAGENTIRRLSAITDRNDNRIDFDRDPIGTVTAVRHHGGYHIDVGTERGELTELRLRNISGPDIALVRYRYHDSGFLAEVVNSSGKALRFTYDSDGRLTQWTDRNDEWYRYLYDAEGRCIANQGSGGFLNGTFSYDADNHTTRFTDALGHTTGYQLDERGQVVAETDPLGHTTTSEWDDDRLLSRTDPLGHTTRYEYDTEGNLTRVTRPDGTESLAEYNTLGLPTRSVDPGGATWRRTYDTNGNLLEIVDPSGATTRYEYDETGRLVAVMDALGGTQRIDNDAAGLPIAVTDPLGHTTRYLRDQFGRVVKATDATGGSVTYQWTIEGRPVSRTEPDGSTQWWRYDGEGNEIEHVNAIGARTMTEVTHFDLPKTVVHHDGSRFAFGYDANLRLVAVTNPQGLVWRYEYDPAGRLIKETDFNGTVLQYSYDATGQLVARVNGLGQRTAFVRDAFGNVLERHSADDIAHFEYDPAGRVVRARNADADVVLERDPLGRVTSESVNGRSVQTSYDVVGRIVGRRTPGGAVSRWQYDAGHRPTTLHTAGHLVRFGHDAAGRQTERMLDTGAVVAQTWEHDRVAAQTVSVRLAGQDRARQVQHRRYHYRPDGFVSSIDATTGSRRFTLDPAGRITGVQAADWSERYAYDAAGNIVNAECSAGDPGAQGARRYAGTLLEDAGRLSYAHDAQGRVVRRQLKRLSHKPAQWHYTWNADDRLVGVVTPDGSRWKYSYDAFGRRIGKVRLQADGSIAEQVDFSWDGPTLIEQSQSDGRTTTWDWEPGGTRVLTQLERTSARDAPQEWVDARFYAIVTDLVGSPTELIDESGILAWQAHSTVWGRALARQGTVDTPLRFPGQYYDAETGLHYNFQRYYDPDTGRYQAADPVGLVGGPSPHSYVRNPLAWLDPLGLTPCRNGALNEAKRDLGIPRSQHPEDVTRVPMTDRNGRTVMGDNGQPIMTREYTYIRPDGSPVIIQDHGAGHQFGEGGVGDQGPHFNVRPPENTRTGHVEGTQDHYPFRK